MSYSTANPPPGYPKRARTEVPQPFVVDRGFHYTPIPWVYSEHPTSEEYNSAYQITRPLSFPMGDEVVCLPAIFYSTLTQTIPWESGEEAVALRLKNSPVLQVVPWSMPATIFGPSRIINDGRSVRHTIPGPQVPRTPSHDVEQMYHGWALLTGEGHVLMEGSEVNFTLLLRYNRATPTELSVHITFPTIPVPKTWSREQVVEQIQLWGNLLVDAVRTGATEVNFPLPVHEVHFEPSAEVEIPEGVFDSACFDINCVPPYLYPELLRELHRRVVGRGTIPISPEKAGGHQHSFSVFSFDKDVEMLLQILKHPGCNRTWAEEILQAYAEGGERFLWELEHHRSQSLFRPRRLEALAHLVAIPPLLMEKCRASDEKYSVHTEESITRWNNPVWPPMARMREESTLYVPRSRPLSFGRFPVEDEETS